LAYLNYESDHGTLPPAVVHGPDGKALLSWRVLLLPFLEQQQLYAQFHLDEPWDSPNNIKLLEKMPSLYAPPHYRSDYVPPYHTICHVFVGPGTAFEPPEGHNLGTDFPDGTSNTLLIVEAGNPVPWTKPEEIEYDSKHPIMLRGPFKDYCRVLFADGSRRRVPYSIDESDLRALITRNGNDLIRNYER
jgi:hypothetical protein